MSFYRLLKASEKDLDEIWNYTFNNWGENQANKYLLQLKKRLVYLSNNPDLGQKRDYISPGLFGYHEGRHLILYRKENDGIVIIRVLHDRMNVIERIKESEE